MPQLVDDEGNMAAPDGGICEISLERHQECRTLGQRREGQRDEQHDCVLDVKAPQPVGAPRVTHRSEGVGHRPRVPRDLAQMMSCAEILALHEANELRALEQEREVALDGFCQRGRQGAPALLRPTGHSLEGLTGRRLPLCQDPLEHGAV